jgi:hypothetical protein
LQSKCNFHCVPHVFNSRELEAPQSTVRDFEKFTHQKEELLKVIRLSRYWPKIMISALAPEGFTYLLSSAGAVGIRLQSEPRSIQR